MPEPRTEIQRMRPYNPPTGNRGGKLRLDFNENTGGCPLHVLKAVSEALSKDLLATYPDYEVARQRIADFFEVAEAQILMANGTDEAIQLLVNTFVGPGDEVVVLHPTYAMYRFYAEIAGAKIQEVSYRELPGSEPLERVLQVELDDILDKVGDRTRAIFLPNPNNPTGSTISLETILGVLQAAPYSCVLIDEAYFDFWGVTALALLERNENLFISRTFSKAYGLAGMRFGCLISHAENISNMKKSHSPYSVNSLSIVAVLAAIQDRVWINEYAVQVRQGRELLERELPRHGYSYWKSHANFILFDAGDRADALLQRSLESGVLIRDRRHDLPGALRVTAGLAGQMERFVSVLEELR